MAQRSNPYTQEENARILAQMEACKGEKIPGNVYKTLAWIMGHRHTVASLMSQASRLRRGRSGGPPKPAEEPRPEKAPCKYPVAAPVAREQQGLPLYNSVELVAALRVAAIKLEEIAGQIIEKMDLAEICAKQQERIDELENAIRDQEKSFKVVMGGQA